MRACAMHCPRFSLFRFLSFRAYLSSFLDTYHILLFSHDISSLHRILYLIHLPHEFAEVKRFHRRTAPCVIYFNTAFPNVTAAGILGINVMPASALSRSSSAPCVENLTPLPSITPSRRAAVASPNTTLPSLPPPRDRTAHTMPVASTAVRNMPQMTAHANIGRRDSTEVGSSAITRNRR